MDFISEYSDNEWKTICDEFKRTGDNHYLDHAGTTLFSENQLHDVFQNFSSNLYCNPHTSKSTEDLIDQIRYRILKHFNTNTEDYSIVFTSGATASLKIVGECFDFAGTALNDTGNFVYLRDNHTSVLGMREVVNTKNITYIEKDELLRRSDKTPKQIEETLVTNSLIVYPAQCNFSGYKYSLELIENIQLNGLTEYNDEQPSKWFICLDAASYVSTNYLDLNKYRPDFVSISFYKMFGYPTGLGALIVSKRSQKCLVKKYYGGGTVQIAMSGLNWHRKRECFHERFEDGTIPFLSIISLLSGFNILERLVSVVDNKTTMTRISKHCFNLSQYLYNNLAQLKYPNCAPVIKFYHDTDFTSIDNQGAILNFNVLHEDGTFVGFAEISCMASIFKIYLRTGCFCNPGACQRHLGLTNDELQTHYKAGHVCGDSNDLIDGVPTGSVRISIGYMTTKDNVDAVIDMITNCYVQCNTKYLLKPEDIKNVYKIDACNLNNPKNELEKPNAHRFDYVNKMKDSWIEKDISGIEFAVQENILKSNKNHFYRTKLKQICVYPVKSCAAFKIYTKWLLNKRGLKYDREWMIVDSSGVSVTQKKDTKLCLIQPKIHEKEGVLELCFPYMNSVRVPLEIDKHRTNTLASLCQSKVCGDRIEGIDCGDEVAHWLSDALCTSGLRLIRQTMEDKRTFENKSLKEDPTLHLISLTNQAQFLLINTTSVNWLVNKVEDWNELDNVNDDKLQGVVDRFRGNLIVEAPGVLEELEWVTFQIGNIKLRADGPCMRCQMICIDQSTGDKTTEPLRTIAKEFKGKIKFGIYLSQIAENDDERYISCDNDVIIEPKM